ncbi:MAG: hypothetical protein JXR59_04435 [Desulfuromonadaceae bacterium]|nr:hypothetical protein [Desulfuromonadaceae bacterium]
MLVTPDQKAIFILARAILKENRLSVPMLHKGQDIHYASASRPGLLEWAIEYSLCLPQAKSDQQLLEKLHIYPNDRWSADETRRAASCYKTFYAKLREQRTLAVGTRWLNSGGRQIVMNYLQNP